MDFQVAMWDAPWDWALNRRCFSLVFMQFKHVTDKFLTASPRTIVRLCLYHRWYPVYPIYRNRKDALWYVKYLLACLSPSNIISTIT